MRRVRILFYWLFFNKNNLSFFELLKFLIKPKVDVIAKKFIKKIDSSDEYNKVTFLNLNRELYWPKKFAVSGIFQVTAETFDKKDWRDNVNYSGVPLNFVGNWYRRSIVSISCIG